jgi:hypothetical protein
VVDWIVWMWTVLFYSTRRRVQYYSYSLTSSCLHSLTRSHIVHCTTEVNTEAIAKEKALLGAQLAGGPCVVEDTSLEFQALGTRTHTCMDYLSLFDEIVCCLLRGIYAFILMFALLP